MLWKTKTVKNGYYKQTIYTDRYTDKTLNNRYLIPK